MARKAFAMKRDLNEPEIVDAFVEQGFVVFRLDGPADLLVWCPEHRVWFCWEVKDPKRMGRLTNQQVIDHTRTSIWIAGSGEQIREVAHEACLETLRGASHGPF